MTLLHLSNSEMSTWRRCRRKWWFGTYRELGPRAELVAGTASKLGVLVHDALSGYYADHLDPVTHVRDWERATLLRHPEEDTEIRKQADLSAIMLEGYLEWLEETGADAELTVLGTEMAVEVVLIPGVTLLSKLDAPVERESDGAKLDLEHKTVSTMTPPAQLKLDTQLLTEHLARFLHTREQGATDEEAYAACHGVLYNMLRKVKRTPSASPPFYGRETVPHNIHELRAHWRHVAAIAREIQQARERLDAGESHHSVAPPNPTRDCHWDCEFFKVCVMADDGSHLEGALEAIYVRRDPLERYADAESL
jgi:hypothetical protein